MDGSMNERIALAAVSLVGFKKSTGGSTVAAIIGLFLALVVAISLPYPRITEHSIV